MAADEEARQKELEREKLIQEIRRRAEEAELKRIEDEERRSAALGASLKSASASPSAAAPQPVSPSTPGPPEAAPPGPKPAPEQRAPEPAPPPLPAHLPPSSASPISGRNSISHWIAVWPRRLLRCSLL